MSFTSRIVAVLAKLPAAHTFEVAVERDLAAKMPDGAELLADRWYPVRAASGSPPPTVLLRSPYGRHQLGLVGRIFAERGFQAVIQSCRGTFGSAGDWVPMRNEQVDGHATAAWVASQPWFNGDLVTFGPSYLGLTQWGVAEDPPDCMRAMALNVTASNFRDAVVYPGGSFALETALAWMYQVDHQELRPRQVVRAMMSAPKTVAAASRVLPLSDADRAGVGHRSDFYQDWLSHELPGDDWWDVINHGRKLEAVPPATLVGGWYDIFLPSQIADYEALHAAGRTARLTVGPWTHASPGGLGMALRDALGFYDEQLKRTAARRGAVQLFVMGSKRWQEFAEWPPTADAQKWYLGRNGTLGTEVPAEPDDQSDRWRYDPADPTPAAGGPALLSKTAGRKDQRAREARSDVLTYTSAVLNRDLTVIGPISASLHVKSSLEHTDFFVRLCDVSEKGKSTNLSDGIVRLSPASVSKQADGSFRLDISLWPTANTFKIGHRVRFQVSSGAHPLFARNPGTGERLGSATTLRVANQEIWHNRDRPSWVTLPVV
jgi:putative CocE/NonD family hydrolase